MRRETASPWGVALILISSLALAAPGAAESAVDAASSELVEELRQLNRSLKEIRDLLAEQVRTESLELLLKRSELTAAGIARLEDQIRGSEASRRSMENERQGFRFQLELLETQREHSVAEEDRDTFETHLVQATSHLEQLEEQIRDIDLETAELRNRLAARQEELREWQDLLDSHLGSR